MYGSATRGKRLKSADRVPGALPFVTAGEAEQGVSAFIGNDVVVFKQNTVTIDMFGSAKYRSYNYGADDHVAVVHTEELSQRAAIFVASALNKAAHTGAFDYSRNFYAKDADALTIKLPVDQKGNPDYKAMDNYIGTLEAGRINALDKYLNDTGLNDYKLTDEESSAVSGFQNGGGITWSKFFLEDLFTIKNTTNLIKSEITDFNGQTPYVGASRECNGITAYINYNQQLLMQGDTLFIGGKTFTVFYQPDDYFSNDSHNIWLKLKTSVLDSKHTYQFMAACIYNALSDKYEWGNSISRAKIRNDSVYLPVLADGTPNYDAMAIYMRAVEKSVIKDVVNWKNVQLADLTNAHYA